ncbi:MAG: hypothetical protein PF961_00595 [Planctomycetota bacterium]|jgi:Flp pilus assembly protein TadB|nr:hypothetical protein [Planctomycetota bacterium]
MDASPAARGPVLGLIFALVALLTVLAVINALQWSRYQTARAELRELQGQLQAYQSLQATMDAWAAEWRVEKRELIRQQREAQLQQSNIDE